MSQSRQLAAIMFTDIVGYTALMGEDEERAFELLKRNREIQRPIIESRNGRWLKEIGDGVLASFKTITDAVYAAAEIQKTCELESDLKLRIGIHEGEVVFEGEDIFGSGVNIASRLEPLAPVGGIMVSDSIYKNVINKKGITTTLIGEKQLRGVNEPVTVYQLEIKNIQIPASITSVQNRNLDRNSDTSPPKNYSIKAWIIATAILLALGYILFHYFTKEQSTSTTIPQINDKSIAVLPFRNVSSDPEQEALCDGLTEEIIHYLSQIKSFDKVISRSSVMSLKNSDKTLPEKAALLKVNFVLEGSFQQSGDQIKITAQLIDAINDNHIWSEIYERPFGDIFKIQSDIAKNIANKFKAEITRSEQVRLDKIPTENSEAYIYFLKGLYAFQIPNNWQVTIELLNKAIELDPGFAEAYAYLAFTYLTADVAYLGDKSIPVEDPLPHVKKALTLNSELGTAYLVLAAIKFWKEWNFLEAEKAAQKAVELGNSISYDLYGEILIKTGRAAESLPIREKHVVLDPTYSLRLLSLAEAYFYSGESEKANEALKEYESIFPDRPTGEVGQLYLYLSNFEKAIENLERALNVPTPRFMSCLAISYSKTSQDQKVQNLVDQLKQMSKEKVAGSPEYFTALFYSGTGQKEEALIWLDKAYDSHDTELTWLKVDPMFTPLHGDPRYEELCRKVGFPE